MLPRTGISMLATVSPLDRMLYDWLAETDDRRFDLAFKRYYAEASSQLVRYLARRSSLPDLDCEQIAVDALLKFFTRVGRDRRQAAASISAALSRIEPLDLGPFHVRQVQRWTQDTGAFKQATLSFRPESATMGTFKSQIEALTERIPPLQRQGCHLVESARRVVTERAAATSATAGVCDEIAHDDAAADEEAISPEFRLLREFVAALRAAPIAGGTVDAESGCPGLLCFVDGSWTVVEELPALRVPTNGYLFDIAQSLYLDECKARGRRKRGGSGYTAGGAAALRDPAAEVYGPATSASTTAFSLEDSNWPEEDTDDGRAASSVRDFGVALAEIGVDPTEEQIDEDFCEQFYAYLRKPVQEAEEAYARAATRGRADAERKRLESIAKKNERLLTVLTLRIEGRTQEEIAATLDISRNQVKYMVELVQSAYEHFAAASARTGRT